MRSTKTNVYTPNLNGWYVACHPVACARSCVTVSRVPGRASLRAYHPAAYPRRVPPVVCHSVTRPRSRVTPSRVTPSCVTPSRVPGRVSPRRVPPVVCHPATCPRSRVTPSRTPVPSCVASSSVRHPKSLFAVPSSSQCPTHLPEEGPPDPVESQTERRPVDRKEDNVPFKVNLLRESPTQKIQRILLRQFRSCVDSDLWSRHSPLRT